MTRNSEGTLGTEGRLAAYKDFKPTVKKKIRFSVLNYKEPTINEFGSTYFPQAIKRPQPCITPQQHPDRGPR